MNFCIYLLVLKIFNSKVHADYELDHLQLPTGAVPPEFMRSFKEAHPQKRENFKHFMKWCEATLETRAKILRDKGIAEFDAYIKDGHPIDMSPGQLKHFGTIHQFAKERPDLPWENSKHLCALMLENGKEQHKKLRVFAYAFWKSCKY